MPDTTGKPRVLHVDDDCIFLEVFSNSFSPWLDITSVRSAAKALEELKSGIFDAVVLDYDMPKVNGLELLYTVKEIFPDMPVIFCTGQGNEGIAREAFTIGASDYFTKDLLGFAHRDKIVHSIYRAVEKNRVDAKAKVSEEKYRNLVENLNDGILVLDNAANVVYANHQMADMLGYTGEELIGINILPILNSDCPSGLKERLTNPDNPGEGRRSFECTFTRKDGSVINTHVSTAPDLDPDGIAVGTIAAVMDITKRKIAEEEQKKNREFMDNIINAIDDPVFVKDEKHRFVLLNDRLCSLIGFSRDDLLGKNDRDVFPPDQVKVFWEKDELVMRTGEPDINEEYITWQGKVRKISTKKALFVDSTSGKKYIVGTIREIDDLTRANEKIEKLNECFLSFNQDHMANINKLVGLVGTLLNAACALYNRLDSGMLCSLGQWNTPPGYDPVDTPDGHICYDVITRTGEDIYIVNDLHKTGYFESDPNVAKYSLQAYIGKMVKCFGEPVGSLCVVYQQNVQPDDDEKKLMEIAASAIGLEEERKKTKDELKESEQRLKSIADSVPGAVFQLTRNKEGQYRASYVYQDIFGILDPEKESANPTELIRNFCPGRAAEMNESIRESFENLKPVSVEFCLGTCRHHTNWLKGTMAPQKLSDGAMAWNCVLLDVTDLKQTEEALKLNQQRYKAATGASRVGVWDYEIKKQRLYLSPNLADITGRPLEEIDSLEGWKKIIHPDDFDTLIKKAGDFIEGRADEFRQEYRIVNKDESITWMLVNAGLIKDEQGRAVRILGTSTDITLQKKMQARLVRTNRELNDFSYRVSHDLKNYLRNIKGFAALMESHPEKQKKFLKKIQNNADGVINFINRILSLSRAGRVLGKKKKINIKKKIKMFFNLILLEHKNGELRFKGEIPDIYADPDQLDHVFTNLIQNSFRFRSPEREKVKITISHQRENGTDVFRYRDNGVGIEESELENIFLPGVTHSESGGTGFGLAIARKVVEAHGGSIDAFIPEDGVGAGFLIKLPAS